MAGRGSFVESFPLFGLDLGDYDALFSEKLELLLRLRGSERRHAAHASIMRAIELFATGVAPVVRREVERRGAGATAR